MLMQNITALTMLKHIWFILIYLGMYNEQKAGLINHMIISLNALELSTSI